jgi:hypothetical protein
MRNQDTIPDIDRRAGPNPRANPDIAPLSDINLTAVTEDHQFTPDMRMAANDNLLTIAERVPDPRAMGQECASVQAAGCPPDQALHNIV